MNIKRLLRNEAGAAVMEFGLIAPVMVVMLIGTCEMGHGYYVRSVLNGALRDAARESSLEGAASITAQNVIDVNVSRTIKNVAPNATIEIKRRYYKTFSDAAAAKAEVIINDGVNTNNDPTIDKLCDPGEGYYDKNHNGTWDKDGGDAGQGGARDVVIIQAEIRYSRLFPVTKILGLSSGVKIISDSILANQPYGTQQTYAPAVEEECPLTPAV